jgi:hypothetical protein
MLLELTVLDILEDGSFVLLLHAFLHMASNLLGSLKSRALSALASQFARQICHVDGSDRVFGLLEELSVLGDN